MNSPLVQAGRFWFRKRGLMLPIAVILYLLPSPQLIQDPAIVGLSGLAIALVGQLIRSANVGLEYIIRGGKEHKVYAETLVTGGIYSHVRNPMYLGNMFLLVGVAIASNSWLFVLAGIPIGVLIHVAIIAAEEDFLRNKFGVEFDAYCARSPRWFPKLAGLRGTLCRAPFNLRRVLVKEYQKPFDWLVALALIVLINFWLMQSFAKNPVVIGLMVLVIVVRVALYITARAVIVKEQLASAGR